ncbi:MAG: acetylglutamate kinase, partial [Spirochaetia bacterium]|nr:acetylglutamate kinase [Spirochaetia bacterium]
GKTVVIKYGGAALDNQESLREQFAEDLVLLHYVGVRPVIIHGGGPRINSLLGQMGVQSKFIGGVRVTDNATMEAVEMVLSASINKEIVSLIDKKGGRAVGISGRDGRLASATPASADLGRVGQVNKKNIDPSVINTFLQNGYIPVIAPVAAGPDLQSLNVNADTMAGAIAAAIGAEKFMLLTDTPGVLQNGTTKQRLGAPEARAMIASGEISGGMIPKVECCLTAFEEGVKQIHIIDGRVPHAILLEIFTHEGVGTMIE